MWFELIFWILLQLFNPYKDKDRQIWNDIQPTLSEVLTKLKTMATVSSIILSGDKDDVQLELLQLLNGTSFEYFLWVVTFIKIYYIV